MIDSGDQLVSELVKDPNCLYKISNYQRFYVWNESKVDAYLNDIIVTISRREQDPSVTHYFGQFILLKGDHDRRQRYTYEVIDGQQRLTTFLLFVATMYGKASVIAQSHPEVAKSAARFQEECSDYLESIKPGASREPKLKLSETDNAYFSAIISNLRSNDEVEKHTSPESHKRLYGAQLRICEKLDAIIINEATATAKIDILEKLLFTATKAFQVVVLSPTEEKYTYQLYQVVNDRGEPLTEGELLKAKSIEVLASKEQFATRAREIWADILKDPGSTTDEYLKWCYMSKLGAEKDTDRYYRAFLEEYFHLPHTGIVTDDIQHQFMNDLQGLHDDIIICRKLALGIWPYAQHESSPPEWKKSVLRNLVVGRKHKLCIPVLLSAYKQSGYKKTADSEQNFYNCLELCETFFAIVKGVFGWNETKLKVRYLYAAKQMRKNEQSFRSQQFQELLAKNIEPKTVHDECLLKIQNMTYTAKGDNAAMKHFCILLETYWRCFEGGRVYTNRVPDGTNLVYDELSLEHIYPESAPDGTSDIELEVNKHRLGNLLIFGKKDNSKLRNKSYEQKKPIYQTARFATAYDLVNSANQWTMNEYRTRHEDVCKKLEILLLRFYPSQT